MDPLAISSPAAPVEEVYLRRLTALCELDTHTGDVPALDSAAQLLATWAREAGCRVDMFAGPSGGHLRATLTGSGRGRVLLVGHHDTVWPSGTAAERPLRVDGVRGLALGDRHGFAAVELHSLPVPAMGRSEPLVGLARALFADAGGSVPDEHAGGASDACWASWLGIPSIDGLGPVGAHVVAGVCMAAVEALAQRRDDGER